MIAEVASRLYVAQGLINFTQDFTVQTVDSHLQGKLGAIGLGICGLHMLHLGGNGAACQSAIRVLGPERLLASRKCPLCFSIYKCSCMGSRKTDSVFGQPGSLLPACTGIYNRPSRSAACFLPSDRTHTDPALPTSTPRVKSAG